jgi:hypothetical protein
MLSKSLPVATTALVAILFASCSLLPWQREAPPNEVNLGFTFENNLVFLTTAEINNHSGRVLFGSANLRTILDPAFAERVRGHNYRLQLNHRESIPFTPVVMNLGGVGDAIVGADIWDAKAVTIDYRAGLVTYQKEGIYPDYMTIFRYDGEPKVLAEVDGRAIPAVVDTALPDTLVVPRGETPAGRRTAHVNIAGTDFGKIDIAAGNVAQARIGNRLLSKFLVSVDYGRRQVGLWRDPRIPM